MTNYKIYLAGMLCATTRYNQSDVLSIIAALQRYKHRYESTYANGWPINECSYFLKDYLQLTMLHMFLRAYEVQIEIYHNGRDIDTLIYDGLIFKFVNINPTKSVANLTLNDVTF